MMRKYREPLPWTVVQDENESPLDEDTATNSEDSLDYGWLAETSKQKPHPNKVELSGGMADETSTTHTPGFLHSAPDPPAIANSLGSVVRSAVGNVSKTDVAFRWNDASMKSRPNRCLPYNDGKALRASNHLAIHVPGSLVTMPGYNSKESPGQAKCSMIAGRKRAEHRIKRAYATSRNMDLRVAQPLQPINEEASFSPKLVSSPLTFVTNWI